MTRSVLFPYPIMPINRDLPDRYLSVFLSDGTVLAVQDTAAARTALNAAIGNPVEEDPLVVRVMLVAGVEATLRDVYIGGWCESTPESRERQRWFEEALHDERDAEDWQK